MVESELNHEATITLLFQFTQNNKRGNNNHHPKRQQRRTKIKIVYYSNLINKKINFRCCGREKPFISHRTNIQFVSKNMFSYINMIYIYSRTSTKASNIYYTLIPEISY